MKPTITTHDHAPATLEQVEQMLIDRAESDAFEVAQTFANCRKPPLTDAQRDEQLDDMRSDLKKILRIIEDQQKQKQLDAEMTQINLTNAQYNLGKARAERTAAVLLLVMFVAVTMGVVL